MTERSSISLFFCAVVQRIRAILGFGGYWCRRIAGEQFRIWRRHMGESAIAQKSDD